MWQRFTERARRVVFFAQEEAQRYGVDYVSSEHLLLGLCREEDTTAAAVMLSYGIRLSEIRGAVEQRLQPAEIRPHPEMTLTPQCKRVIDMAYDEAVQLRNNWIGTEHLLLALIRDDGMAGSVLSALGVQVEAARAAVEGLQEDSSERQQHAQMGHVEPTPAQTALAARLSELLSLCTLFRQRTHVLDFLVLLLMAEGDAQLRKALEASGTDERSITVGVERLIAGTARGPVSSPPEGIFGTALARASAEAGDREVSVGHLFLSIAEQPGSALATALAQQGVTVQSVRDALRAGKEG